MTDGGHELRTLFAHDLAARHTGKDMVQTEATVALPFLDGTQLPLSYFADKMAWARILDCLPHLIAQPSGIRETIAQALFDAYKEMSDFLVDEIGDYASAAEMISYHGADRGFTDLTPPQTPDDIWRLVTWEEIFFDPSFDEAGVNVIVCGRVAWDEEHEIGLFFRDGQTFLTASDPSLAI